LPDWIPIEDAAPTAAHFITLTSSATMERPKGRLSKGRLSMVAEDVGVMKWADVGAASSIGIQSGKIINNSHEFFLKFCFFSGLILHFSQ
jgi:hypothetical protein